MNCKQSWRRNNATGRRTTIISSMLLIASFASIAVPPPKGVAPITIPAGGFAIDGDLLANTPQGTGDWVPGPAGAGVGVLDSAGRPVNPATTLHFVDPFDSSDLTFSGGLKWTDDPGKWSWTTGKASSKTDINNVLMHVSVDASNHTWLIIAADRASNSGDSYIDFEFLQNPVYRTSTNTFYSLGPNGGRTANDLLLSLAFTSGGSVPDFFAWRWQTNGAGSYTYADATASLPVGRVFVAASSNTTSVPFGAFGSTNYDANDFAEAAIDLTALVGAFDSCLSIGVQTIIVKTKTSQSSSATIIDFIDPIQYSLRLGPGAVAGPDQRRCIEGETTGFPLNGQATAGLFPIASNQWSVISGSAIIDDPSSLTTVARVSSAAATLRLTVTQANGCTESDDVVLAVLPLPVGAISGPAFVCPASSRQFQGSAGMSAYSWTVAGSGAITGPTNSATVTVAAAPVCGTNFTLTLTVASNTCSSSTSYLVEVNDTNAPSLVRPADVVQECPGDLRTNVTGTARAQDDCGSVQVSFSDSITNTCGGARVVSRTWTATDLCGNSATALQTIIVRDTTSPTIIPPADIVLECPANTTTNATGVASASDSCGSVAITFSDSVSNSCGGTKLISRVWTAVDDCGNTRSAAQKITVRDTTPPAITPPADLVLECPANTSTNNTGAASATDTCGAVVISFSDSLKTNCGGTKVISRTWSATDECGNSRSAIQSLTVRDTTPPAITAPVDVVLECPATTSTNNTGVATAEDGCGSIAVTYSDSVSNSCGGTKIIARTWTAADQCGNRATALQKITVRDTTPPSITPPSDLVLECPADTTTNRTGTATASDSCGSVAVVFSDSVSNNCGGTKVISRNWTATDACGNSRSALQTITVRDTMAPALTVPQNVALECPADTRTNVTGVATAQDTCGAVIISYRDAVTNSCGGTRIISRSWIATDDCGNTRTAMQTITVRDTTAPVLTIPGNLVLECPADIRTNATGVATAVDGCGQVTVTYSDSVSNGCGGTKIVSRTWAAVDECGNTTSRTQLLTVRDTTPPSLVLPNNLVLECPANLTTNNTGVASAQDSCGSVIISYSDAVTNNCGGTKLLLRTWTAVDQCGNTTNAIQQITVRDSTPPAITPPPAIVLECPAEPATNVTGTATAQDGCGQVAVTYTDAVTNRCGNTRSIVRTWTASDTCGNVARATQGITIRDTTPPVLTIPADLVLECPANTVTNATGTATAQDTCGSVVIRYSDSVSNLCGNTKVIARTWTATDDCGNVTSKVQKITVQDTVAPSITVPADLVVECGSSTAPAATGTASGQDSCGSVQVTYSDTVSNSCGGTGIISRAWRVVDSCGNSTNRTQTITVRDTTAPALKLPADIVLECPGDTRPSVTGTATATDACGSTTMTYSDVVTNGCGSTRTVFRTWTATDQCGNYSTGLQTITVADTRKPTISCRNISVQCPGDLPAPYQSLTAFLAAGGTATDACDSSLSFSLVSDSGIVGRCPGTVTRIYRVTDACGNYSDGTQTITVDDTIAPVLSCPTNVTVECGTPLEPANLGQITATDNCSTNVAITYTDTMVPSQYLVKWYAADSSPNSGPYAPTYMKLGPASLSCPDAARLTGRATDPLRNAVAYGPNASTLDALTSLNADNMCFGQIVPFEAVIEVSGGSVRPENGTIEFTANWSTHTTSNDEFGYDKNYMVYCAFVDLADLGMYDPDNNARVESFRSTVVNSGQINEQIQGTFRISGLNSGDRVVVEIWMVLKASASRNFGGTIASELIAAQKATLPPEPITTGNQTVSIGSLSKLSPLPAPQDQPPAPAPAPIPPKLPGCSVAVIDRTWRATDDCGNQSTCVQRISVRDTTMPVLTIPDVTLEYPAETGTNVTGVPVISETCTPATLTFTDLVSTNCGNTKTIARTWTAGDMCGNIGTAIQTIAVRDTTSPVLTVPSNVTIECPGNVSPDATGSASATDASGPPSISYTDQVTTNCGISRVIARHWVATDVCGNTTEQVQSITVQDTTLPTITAPANLVLEVPAETGTNATGFAIAQDTCGDVIVTFSDVVATDCGSANVITRTWTATDACGNRSTAVQTITLRDSSAPTITAPADLVIEAPAETGTNATGIAIAQDAGGSVTVTYSDLVATNCGSTKVITRNWTATDACGNHSSAIQRITVQDTTAPTVTAPPDVILEAPAETGTNSTGIATAQDTGGSAVVSYSDVVVTNCGSTKVITRTWTATDECGNRASANQTITVRDTMAPQIACVVVESLGTNLHDTLQASYLKVFSEGLTIGKPSANHLTWTPDQTGLQALESALSEKAFITGVLTQTATNSATTLGGGQLGYAAILLTLNIGLNTAGTIGIAPNNFDALVYTAPGDSLSGSSVQQILDIANNALSGGGLPTGYTPETLTSLIDELNSAFQSRSTSTWAKTYLSAPAVTIECPSEVPALEAAWVVASDASGLPVTVTSLADVLTDYSSPNRYTITRTWQATDACGNTAAASFHIVVNDVTPPTLVVAPVKTVSGTDVWNFDEPTAADNCSTVSVRIVGTVTNLTIGNGMIAVRTWEAADVCGNTATCEQTVTVVNTLPTQAPAVSSSPECRTGSVDGDTSLCVTASGTGPFTYQWQVNGRNIDGATSSSLALNHLQFTNAGVYTVVVGNAAGTVTSAGAVVDVLPKLSIQPAAGGVRLAWPAPFILQAAPTPTGRYADVLGAVSPYTAPVSGTTQRYFRLRSEPFALRMISSPAGRGLEVSGVPGLNFVIQASSNLVNWVNLQTNTAPAAFMDPEASSVPMRYYRVVLAQAKLSGNGVGPEPPAITAAPIAQNLMYGRNGLLAVSASGSGPLAYQWRLNGSDIAGATDSSLALDNATFGNAGLYTVRVSNDAGAITSAVVTVTVAPPLNIAAVGQNLTLSWEGRFMLQFAPAASGPFSDIPGATSPYTVNSTAVQGFFRLRAVDPTVSVNTIAPGQASVTITGSPGALYLIQWSTDLLHWTTFAQSTLPCSVSDISPASGTKFYRAIPAN